MKKEAGSKDTRKKGIWTIVAIVIILLIGLRIYLPTMIVNFVNKKINAMPGYRGEVEDVDIFLLKGAYEITGVKLIKTGGDIPVPYFTARFIRFSVDWHSLIKYRAIVGNIKVVEPKLSFVKGSTEPETQMEVDWREAVKDLMYIEISCFRIEEGQFHYKDVTSNPEIGLVIENINATAENLTNRSTEEELLPSDIKFSANALGGNIVFDMGIAPLNEDPTFELAARIEKIDLVKLNDFLHAYGNFDVQKGAFSLYMEVAAKDGRFTGYAKPFFKDLEILPGVMKEKSLLQTLWENIVEGSKEILENPEKEQVATRIPISGKFDDPELNIWNAIYILLRNAFIEALVPTLDYSVNIEDVNEKEGEKGKNGK